MDEDTRYTFTSRAYLYQVGMKRFLLIALDEHIRYVFNLNGTSAPEQLRVGAERQPLEAALPALQSISTDVAMKLGADVYRGEPTHEFWHMAATVIVSWEREWSDGLQSGMIPKKLDIKFFKGHYAATFELAQKFGHMF